MTIQMKRCSKCDAVKPTSDFYKLSRSKDGLNPECAECQKTRGRKWREANPDRYREIGFKGNMKAKYGLTPEAYGVMLERQGGACEICGELNPDGSRLAVDHNHACCPGRESCGKCIRALLCRSCNIAIANLRDSPTRARLAADYLELHQLKPE